MTEAARRVDRWRQFGPAPTTDDVPGSEPAKKAKTDTASIEEQGYFHGKISIKSAERLLKSVGDYLVRKRGDGGLALSVKTLGKVAHLLIQPDVPGKFRFDGEAKDSVDELINYYKATDLSVTNQSGAKLKTAVNRSEAAAAVLLRTKAASPPTTVYLIRHGER